MTREDDDDEETESKKRWLPGEASKPGAKRAPPEKAPIAVNGGDEGGGGVDSGEAGTIGGGLELEGAALLEANVAANGAGRGACINACDAAAAPPSTLINSLPVIAL